MIKVLHLFPKPWFDEIWFTGWKNIGWYKFQACYQKLFSHETSLFFLDTIFTQQNNHTHQRRTDDWWGRGRWGDVRSASQNPPALLRPNSGRNCKGLLFMVLSIWPNNTLFSKKKRWPIHTRVQKSCPIWDQNRPNRYTISDQNG